MKNKLLIAAFFCAFLLIAPSAKAANFVDNQTVDLGKTWTITFNQEVLFDTVTKQAIAVTDSKGNKTNVNFKLGSNNKSIIVYSPTSGYTVGENYTLTVGRQCHNKNGKQMKKDIAIHFSVKRAVTSVSLNKTADTLTAGHTDTLTAAVVPSNATNQAVKWTTSNNAIAAVDNTGKVTAVKAGTAKITATTADGNKVASCSVTVNNAKIKGIDVSQWQGKINWALVKSDGVQFAMIRSSYGDGTSSYANKGTDPMFETNYAAAKANKIAVGAYHHSHAVTVAQAAKEANFFISKLKGKQFDYPVCVDMEDQSQESLDKKTLTDIALTYMNMLKQAGYYPMIYANKNWFTSVLDDTRLTSYDHWLAQWANSITYTGTARVWQYSSTGTVKGITGSVDMDTSFVDYAFKIKSLHVNGF